VKIVILSPRARGDNEALHSVDRDTVLFGTTSACIRIMDKDFSGNGGFPQSKDAHREILPARNIVLCGIINVCIRVKHRAFTRVKGENRKSDRKKRRRKRRDFGIVL
jgi:hypothetical protein